MDQLTYCLLGKKIGTSMSKLLSVRISLTQMKRKTNSSCQILTVLKVFSDKPGPEIIIFFYSTQLSMKFFLLIHVKMPTIVGILTFMCGKNSILGLSEPKKAKFLDIFILMSI